MENTLARRILAILVACTMCMGAAFALAGCGSDDEQVIKEGIAEELDAFKNPTEENLAPYMEEVDSSDLAALEQYGIDLYEFLGHAFRGFDYTIGEISVDGDTATADISVTNIDIEAAMNSAMESIQNDTDAAAKLAELASGDDMTTAMSYVFDLVYDAMDAEQETVTSDTTINLTKNGNEWTVDEDSLSDLISGMYGGMTL